MLQTLFIQNLILIEKAEVHFGSHLNILTGETGAGKSAFLTALRLIAGERGSTEWIGKHGQVCIIEAVFDGPHLLRREIHQSGKSRSFINDELVTLAELREKSAPLLEIVDQGSFFALQKEIVQRDLLDQFCGAMPFRLKLEALLAQIRSSESEKDELEKLFVERERKLEWAKKDLNLIEKAMWQEGEEEAFVQEHRLLASKAKLWALLSPITAEDPPLATRLTQLRRLLEKAEEIDPFFGALRKGVNELALQMHEHISELENYLGKIEADPLRLEEIETRLADIQQLKKRFGNTRKSILEKEALLKEEMNTLLHLEERQQELTVRLEKLREEGEKQAEEISKRRNQGALELQSRMLPILHELNLPHADLSIRLHPKPLSDTGKEMVCFYFSANLGHPPKPLSECVSGGELSRILLSLKISMASEKNTTLIFDEIDSNVGGKSASILAQNLLNLAQSQQIICITHFVQVARLATDHFLAFKSQEGSLAKTWIQKLTNKEKESEYARMMGSKI